MEGLSETQRNRNSRTQLAAASKCLKEGFIPLALNPLWNARLLPHELPNSLSPIIISTEILRLNPQRDPAQNVIECQAKQLTRLW